MSSSLSSCAGFRRARRVYRRGVVCVPSTLNVRDLCLGGPVARGSQIGLDSFCTRELALPPHPCHHAGMDTSTTPCISPVLEPETMTALMLRYIDGQEETAYQYARALVRRLSADLSTHDALRLARNIVTEITNDIVTFEEEETAGRVDVALRRLIDRVEAELTD